MARASSPGPRRTSTPVAKLSDSVRSSSRARPSSLHLNGTSSMVAPQSSWAYIARPSSPSRGGGGGGGFVHRPPSPAPSTSPTSTRRASSPSPRPSLPQESVYRSVPPYRPPSPALTRPSSPVSSFHHHPRPSSSFSTSNESILLEVYGDSFCSVFTLLKDYVNVHKFKGASSRGLNNPQSSLQVGREIVRRMKSSRPKNVLLQFSAVDLHLNYLWQLKSRGNEAMRPSEFVRLVIDEYTSYLSNQILPLAQQIGTRVYVAGVLPPVVEDRYLELSASKHLEKTTSTVLPPLSHSSQPHDMLTRRAMVKLHNQLLSHFCSRHSQTFTYVSINKYLYSSSNPDRVSRNFLDLQDPTNIHLVWETTLQPWCQELPPLSQILPSLTNRQLKTVNLSKSLELYEKEKKERRMREGSMTRGFSEGAAASRGRGW